MTAPESLPQLPKTWRPRRARIVALTIAAVVMGALLTVAILLPSGGGRPFGLLDRIGIVAVGAAAAGFLVRQALVRLTADEQGLQVVNLFRKHRLAWSDVVAVSLRTGDPWLQLELADGEMLAAMGIQASDGPAAVASAREVAALVNARSHPRGT
jgi:Bacterial PH domain